MTDIVNKKIISLPQVKEILDKIKLEDMDQIQRWTFDYVSKFAKTDSDNAERILKDLVEKCELKEEEAVELINAMPNSIEELRAFTFGWKKLILTDTLDKILEILKSVRKE
ncbi:MAG: RNA polymerase Rpb4 [Nitrososphaeraceae archaeon]|nr:RNA polymerase Rpb4 [Nitrososphaeraceae archaeon]